MIVSKISTYKNAPYYQNISFKERKQREKHLQFVINFMKCPVTTTEKLRVEPIKKTTSRMAKNKSEIICNLIIKELQLSLSH